MSVLYSFVTIEDALLLSYTCGLRPSAFLSSTCRLQMEQPPSHNSAFLRPSYLARHSRPAGKAACPRAMNSRQPSSHPTSSRRAPAVSANLRLNQIVEGVVTRVTSFGAFVDLGDAQTGLVHISEIADTFVQDINQHVSAGQLVAVRVVSLDPAKKRIGLSIRQAVPMTSGYDRVIELGGDWGHPWGDDPETKFMDLGPRPEPRPHHWQADPSLFRKWDSVEHDQ